MPPAPPPRDLAQRAVDPGIAAIHIEMATRYAALAAQPARKIEDPTTGVQAA